MYYLIGENVINNPTERILAGSVDRSIPSTRSKNHRKRGAQNMRIHKTSMSPLEIPMAVTSARCGLASNVIGVSGQSAKRDADHLRTCASDAASLLSDVGPRRYDLQTSARNRRPLGKWGQIACMRGRSGFSVSENDRRELCAESESIGRIRRTAVLQPPSLTYRWSFSLLATQGFLAVH